MPTASSSSKAGCKEIATILVEEIGLRRAFALVTRLKHVASSKTFQNTMDRVEGELNFVDANNVLGGDDHAYDCPERHGGNCNCGKDLV